MGTQESYDGFMGDTKAKEEVVYLVAAKAHEKYAHLLQTLISKKRKNLKCKIYTLKAYEDNMAKRSPNNFVISFGDNSIPKGSPEI